MPAPAVAKGIIVTLSIIAALGIAVAENPQIQAWLEDQRRKIVELLRQIGDELDPQARRAAEAFAFEGRTVANDDGLRNEAAASQQAAALATGRMLSSSPGTVRRIPIRGPADPDEAEERRRKGREYLAQRNQQMYELQQRRKAAKANGDATPTTPTFDALVDSTGMLKTPDEEEEKELPMLPSPPTNEPVSEAVRAETKDIEEKLQNLLQPILADGPSSSGWQAGSAFANPFGDEFEMERSITPKPPVPPKIALERVPDPDISVPDGLSDLTSVEPRPEPEPVDHSHLSYEEQLAIALSLSEQDSPANATGRGHTRSAEEHENVQAAIEASLKDMEGRHVTANSQPLVDLSPSTPVVSPQRSDWERMFDSNRSNNSMKLPLANDAQSEVSDELYRVTPQLTRARLANLDAQQGPARSSLPFDPVRDAASITPQAVQDTMDASFYSAFDDVSPSQPAATTNAQLVDVSGAPHDGTKTPTTQGHSSFGLQTDSDTETFASISQPASRAQSRPRSEISGIEVIDVDEDSDADVLSDEGDGVATPDSWSEVGSRDAESDVEEGVRQPARVEV